MEKKHNQWRLTDREEQLMELLWSSQCPMTSVEISEQFEREGWKSSYVFLLIRSLQKKGMIETCGTQRYGTQYARQLRPVFTKEEYAAKYAAEMNLVSADSVSKVAAALVREAVDAGGDGDSRREILRQMRRMLDEFERE